MAGAGYRIWEVRAWGDPWFELLDSAHKVTFMYLVLGPNARPSGLFVQSIRQMALALNADPEKIAEVMVDFDHDGKVHRDEASGLVWVVNALAINQRLGMGPPVRRSVEQDVAKHVDSPLIQRFLDRYPTLRQPLGNPYPTVTKGLTNPSKHKHKQEQPTDEQEQSKVGRAPDVLWDALVAALGLSPDEIGRTRRGKLNAALRELRELGATPQEITRRAKAYHREHPDWALTETALASHWAAFGRKPSRAAERAEPDPEPNLVPPPAETIAAMQRLVGRSIA